MHSFCYAELLNVCAEWGGSLLEGAAEDQKPPQAAVRSGDHRVSGETQPTHPPGIHGEQHASVTREHLSSKQHVLEQPPIDTRI